MTVYDFSVRSIDGSSRSLRDFQGKVLLIVNVASQCGFTGQYSGLESLYQRYKERGFEVLGFPCNQFAGQEPGSEEEIKNFCETRYNVTFPLFAKIDVNGDKAEALFKYLKSEQKGILGSAGIKWNFTKFLVDRQGRVIDRFAPSSSPESLSSRIEELL